MSETDFFAEMMRRYPDFIRAERRGCLNPLHVPNRLRRYVPLAEVWGLADDIDRERLVERAPKAAKDHLVDTLAFVDDQLDEWLAGPEADSTPPTPEYVAFSAMRMAADFI